MKNLYILLLISVTIAPIWCNAQENEALTKDPAQLARESRSKMVWKRSLMLPGWGQVTNGGLWWIKVPVIYGGFVAGALVFDFNQNAYKDYLAEAQYRLEHNDAAPPWSPYQRADKLTTNNLITAKDYHRRNRDLTVLVMVGWWALNAVEAYTSDMLKNRWSVSEHLSASITPTVIPSPLQGNYSVMPGLKIVFQR